jgi:hypothetical protein
MIAPDVALHTAMAGGSNGSPVLYVPAATARISGDVPAIYDGRARPYRVSGALGGTIGLSFHRFLSVGLEAAWRSFETSAPADGTRDLTRSSISFGANVRVIAKRARLTPWASIGLRFAYDNQQWKRSSVLPDVTESWSLQHEGLAVPLTVGIEHRFGDFAVGPAVTMAYVFARRGCAKITADDPRFIANELCSDADFEKRVTSASDYVTWDLAVVVRWLPITKPK